MKYHILFIFYKNCNLILKEIIFYITKFLKINEHFYKFLKSKHIEFIYLYKEE
jgi:hypothetical protein